jgi:hypothetical protein
LPHRQCGEKLYILVVLNHYSNKKKTSKNEKTLVII